MLEGRFCWVAEALLGDQAVKLLLNRARVLRKAHPQVSLSLLELALTRNGVDESMVSTTDSLQWSQEFSPISLIQDALGLLERRVWHFLPRLNPIVLRLPHYKVHRSRQLTILKGRLGRLGKHFSELVA